MPESIENSYWQNELLIASVAEQYKTKQENIQIASEKTSDNKFWKQLKEKIKPIVKSTSQIKNWLKQAGAPNNFEQLGCSRERLKNSILHMHEIRGRFTVVDMAWLAGILPDEIDEIIDSWLTS
jgi:glycerol dehydrogenase-like iron-containing ADH family enzyme